MKKVFFIIGLGLLSVLSIHAQQLESGTQKLRLKILENKNGEEKLIDTTFAKQEDLDIYFKLHNMNLNPAGNEEIKKALEQALANSKSDTGSNKHVMQFKIVHNSNCTEHNMDTTFRTTDDIILYNKEHGNTKLCPTGTDELNKILQDELTKRRLSPDDTGTKNTIVITDISKQNNSNGKDNTVKLTRKMVIVSDNKTTSAKKMDDNDNNSIANKFSASISPNPNNGSFQLSFNATGKEDVVISVTDITGREVYTETLNRPSKNNTKQITLKQGTAPGEYLVKIMQGKKMTVQKMIIE